MNHATGLRSILVVLQIFLSYLWNVSYKHMTTANTTSPGTTMYSPTLSVWLDSASTRLLFLYESTHYKRNRPTVLMEHVQADLVSAWRRTAVVSWDDSTDGRVFGMIMDFYYNYIYVCSKGRPGCDRCRGKISRALEIGRRNRYIIMLFLLAHGSVRWSVAVILIHLFPTCLATLFLYSYQLKGVI